MPQVRCSSDFMSCRAAKDVGGRGTRKVGDVTSQNASMDLTHLLWHEELLALPSSLAGAVMVCVWDHVGPSWLNEVRCCRKVSTRQDPPGKGIEVRSGNGPPRILYPLWRVRSDSLSCTARTVLCVAIRYPSSRGFVLSRQMLLQRS